MIQVANAKENELLSIYRNRYSDSQDIADAIQKSWDRNIKQWESKPDWLARVPLKRSKVRDPRIFLATESQLNKLTARPFKPMVLPANESDEAKEIASDLQDLFLESYRDRGVKKTVKRGLRSLHFGKLFCIKPYWNSEIDDFDVGYVDPRKVRMSKHATCEDESEFFIERIDTKHLLDLLQLFPNEEEKILKRAGLTKSQVDLTNPKVEYDEVWIGDGVFWVYKDEILSPMQNPYYDFDGILLTPEEKAEIEQRDQETGIAAVNGRRRRQMFAKFKASQSERKGDNGEESQQKYDAYLYNHFSKPRKPYIFGTVLEVEDSPIGRTSLIEMTTPLQEDVDKRKRQIADNAEVVNGITKVDTDKVTMTLADARKAHYDPEGLVYGAGVSTGVTREFGTPLPDFVFADMKDSRIEIDEIFGTTATFRGSAEGGKEPTATGRAILREEGISRLDEYVSLLDYIGAELYGWWLQLIKVKYTESHLVKSLGASKAKRVIEIMQDDIQDGIEVQVAPGQTLPDDSLYRAERAAEDVKAGFIDPITYLERSGGYENPSEAVKAAVLFKASPFTLIEMNDEDIAKLQRGMQILSMVQQAAQPPPPGGGESPDARAQALAQARARIEQITSSPEFRALPPEEQRAKLEEMRSALQRLTGNQ